MVARVAKFMGSLYSTGNTANLEVRYNGVVVQSGPVAATTQNPLPQQQPSTSPTWEQSLFEFATDTDVTGNIPVKITVTGGVLFFSHFQMNYTGKAGLVANDPNVPVDPADPSTWHWENLILPQDFYSDPNSNTLESDGVNNIVKNGQPWEWRVNVGDNTGNWAYPVNDGETIEFDFYVDPVKTVLS